MLRRSIRSVAAAALLLLLPMPALAGTGQESPSGLLDSFIRAVLDWLPSGVELGPGMDPNGTPGELGPGMDPDGASSELGPEMDPDGATGELGPGMDPDGSH